MSSCLPAPSTLSSGPVRVTSSLRPTVYVSPWRLVVRRGRPSGARPPVPVLHSVARPVYMSGPGTQSLLVCTCSPARSSSLSWLKAPCYILVSLSTMSHLYFGVRIKIDCLPSDASPEYLRGMMSMVSKTFTASSVSYEQGEGMTGFVTLPTIPDAVYLIDTLNGISNGAMVDQVLKAEWAACSRSKSTKKPIEPGSPVAKKAKNCAWSSSSGMEPPLPFLASASLAAPPRRSGRQRSKWPPSLS